MTSDRGAKLRAHHSRRYCKATRLVHSLDEAGRVDLLRWIEQNSTREKGTGCRIWHGGVNGAYGHPFGWFRDDSYRPYRLLWAILRGPLRGRDMYRHGLDRHGNPCPPACIELGHARPLGDWADNTNDQVADGTHVQARKVACPRGHEYHQTPRQRVCVVCNTAYKRGFREGVRLGLGREACVSMGQIERDLTKIA